MSSIRTYKRKLILNKETEDRISRWIGVCRMVYNMGLEIQGANRRAGRKYIHKYELMKQLTEIRADYEWVKDVPVSSLQSSIEKLDLAFQNFFKRNKKGIGYPKYSAKKDQTSIRFKYFSIKNGIIRIPKIGAVKTFNDEPILGTTKVVTIKKEVTGYFILITCENAPPRFESESQAIGLDMGLAHFCIDSNGEFIANPKHFKKYERKLRIQNRSLSRKKKGSNRWRKQAKRLSLLHHKIGNIRRDFLHKESMKVAKANSVVYMEDLNIQGMSKNRNLSKHILDAGWGMFRTMLQYKTSVVLVNPKHTSQTCNKCGERDAVSRISQSEFKCTKCGAEANADVNAAQNILSKGIALSR